MNRYLLVLGIFVFGLLMIVDTASAWSEDITYKKNQSKYYEPIYEERYGEGWTQSSDCGTAIMGTNCLWKEGRRKTVADPNIGILQRIYGTYSEQGEDYGQKVETSHRIYIPKVPNDDYSYGLTLNVDYMCENEWDTSLTTVLQAYYRIEFFDNQDNIVSYSSTCYVANFDNRPGHSENLVLDDDGDWHSTDGLSYTVGIIPNIEYLRIKFVLKGSWLTNAQDLDDPDGCGIFYGNIKLNYPIFSGFSYTQGDSLVQISRTLFSNDMDNYVAMSLFGSPVHPDGTDYGSLSCRTPSLYFNNLLGEPNSHVELYYNTIQFNNLGKVILRGYLKVHYYTGNHVYLGTDVNKFFDYNNAIAPYSYIPPTSGVILIDDPTDYPAKYIEVEILITGGWLEDGNGVSLIFSNLKIAGGGGTCLEYLYYYESDYSRIDCADLKKAEWYNPHYYFDEVYGNMLFSFEEYWNKYEVDDAVQSSDFTGSNIDDVKSSDYFVFSGHGGNIGWDTYLCLTSSNLNDIDDNDIGDWGPETEIVFLSACHILGPSTLDSNNRAEWAFHGLYYNHIIMGFTDVSATHAYEQSDFYEQLIIQEQTYTNAYTSAYWEQPWSIIFDDSPHVNEYFWKINPSANKDMDDDESPEDSTYYYLEK